MTKEKLLQFAKFICLFVLLAFMIGPIFMSSKWRNKIWSDSENDPVPDPNPRDDLKIDTVRFEDSIYVVSTKIDTVYRDKINSK